MVDALVGRGQETIVLDNFSTGRFENVTEASAAVRVVHGSVLDSLLVDELVEECDVIVHLAAAVGVELIMNRSLHSLITNIRGAETILEAAHRYGRKVLMASSSEIYGKGNGGPFKEDDDRILGSPKVSRWAYSTSKAVDEILSFAYQREKGLPTIVVRLFNTTGPRQTGSYGMVLPRFVEQALAGEDLRVFGDGLQTRCFCHVLDVVRALCLLLDEPAAEGDVFNVGSTEEVTILELAQRVIEVTGSPSGIELIPYEDAYEDGFEDMRRRHPDIGKVRALTGWVPERSLHTTITDVAAHIERQRRSDPNSANPA